MRRRPAFDPAFRGGRARRTGRLAARTPDTGRSQACDVRPGGASRHARSTRARGLSTARARSRSALADLQIVRSLAPGVKEKRRFPGVSRRWRSFVAIGAQRWMAVDNGRSAGDAIPSSVGKLLEFFALFPPIPRPHAGISYSGSRRLTASARRERPGSGTAERRPGSPRRPAAMSRTPARLEYTASVGESISGFEPVCESHNSAGSKLEYSTDSLRWIATKGKMGRCLQWCSRAMCWPETSGSSDFLVRAVWAWWWRRITPSSIAW